MNTTAFIEVLTNRVNNIVGCYFESAPKNSSFPYAVIGDELVTELETAESGDFITFDIDIWADEKKEGASVELLEICDNIRNHFDTDNIIKKDGVFIGHIGFENQGAVKESEADLYHKRLSITARVFYIGG